MNNNKRKVRPNLPSRNPRGNGNGVERMQSIEGIYHNANFMHAITSQIGNVVKVYTNTGAIYEGILKTFSSAFEIVLELPHKVDTNNPSSLTVNTVTEKIIFKPHDVIFIEIIDCETDYATKDTFQTDTAISKFNGQITEKELEPWDPSGGSLEDLDLEINANGWDVDDMFRKNEQMYGVHSTFDQGLAGYTTQLQNKNSKDYKDAEAKASRIANEIEGNPTCKLRTDLENGDEEEKFAAVVRPSSDESDSSNKYICPPKRKTIPAPVKPVRSNYVKVNENKPSSPPYYSAASSSKPSSTRERVNGVIPEPKPQRVPPNHKPSPSGRSYPSSDNVRTSSNGYPAGNIEPKTATQVTAAPKNPSPVIPASIEPPTPATLVHRKSPQNQPTPEPIVNVQTKPPRGRDEQINELKKFSTNFNLAEPAEEIQVEETSSVNQEEKRLVSEPSTPVNPSTPSNSESPSSDKASTPPSKSKLNPNAKEFVFNPGAKAFSPRSCSTPTSSSTQSRPNTPQTPNYGVPSLPTMVVPTYVVTSQPHYNPPNPQTRYRKVHMGMSQRPEVASQMQVAAATGQPLLAPGPIPAQFTAVPYNPQTHLANQPYHQMVRMVPQPGGGVVPIVQTTINYPTDAGQAQHIPYMTQGAMGAHHNHHNIAVSPQPTNGNVNSTNGSNNNNGHQYSSIHPQYSQSQPQGNPNSYPLMCPMIPAPQPPAPPPQPGPYNTHHLISGVPSSVHLHHHHHHQSHNAVNGQQPHHIQVILPHSQ